jgi:hypothetical protein
MDIFAAVNYQNSELIKNVRQSADKKFGDKNSYVKNLWVLKEYKRRGGKVSYEGKKPSNKKIEKQVAGVSLDFSEEILTILIRSEAKKLNDDELTEEAEAFLEDYACDTLEDFFEEEIFAADKDKIGEIYQKYHSLVNMSHSQLKKWSENPCSRAASLSRGPISRNLRLLSKSKDQWTAADARSANRTISFISRMKGAEQGEKVKGPDGQSCPSKRDISLMNWAFRP